jgi:fucose 4-O-acetylase-like acetyltransferase
MSRDTSVDIIKGWAMFTIIIFHASSGCFYGYVPSLLGNAWNVAVFFIVAGFFLKTEELSKPIPFIKRKLKRLYIPATIIYSIAILLHNVFVHIGWYPLEHLHPATGTPFYLYSVKEIIVDLIKVLLTAASGELVMGAMWFLYTLLYAFIGMSLVYWVICRYTKTEKSRFWLMTTIVLAVSTTSCVLSQNYNLTFSRLSTAMTAMSLIWWGHILNKKAASVPPL